MVIKMKDLIKAQTDELRKKFIWNEGEDGGEEKPPEPQKLKIDIPDTPFEPDINQVKDRLKQILKQWQVGKYPSDEYRWKSYFKDVQKLVNHLDGEK
jgi:hypothetical protein